MNATKKRILTIIAAITVILVLCTVISQSVRTASLTKVQTVEISSGPISLWSEYEADVWYKDSVKQLAGGAWSVREVFAVNGDTVSEGTPLFRIDTSASSVELMQLRLEIERLESELQLSAEESSEYYNYVSAKRKYEELSSAVENNTDNSYINAESSLDGAKINYDNALKEYEKAKEEYDSGITSEYLALESQLDEYEYSAEKAQKELDELNKKIRDKKYDELLKTEEYLNFKSLSDEYKKAATTELYREMKKAEEKYLKLCAEIDLEREKTSRELEQQIENSNRNYDITVQKIDESSRQTSERYKTAQVNLENAEKAYNDAKIFFDNVRKNLDTGLKELEEQYMQAEASFRLLDSSNLLNTSELEIAYAKLDNQLAAYPEDGIVTACANGTLFNFNLEEGDSVYLNQCFCEIITEGSKPYARFTVAGSTMKKYNSKVDVNISYTYIDYENGAPKYGDDTLISYIATKDYNKENDTWTVYSPIVTDKKFSNDTAMSIRMTNTTGSYDIVIPAACLLKSGSDYFVFRVDERDGIWGIENYLTRVKVTVEYTNNITCAVSSGELYNGAEIMQYSSSSVSSGDTVYITEK